MRVRGYPDNLVNKVLAEVKFTERKLVSLTAVFWMSRNALGGALRDIQKTAAKETKKVGSSTKTALSSKRIKMPFVTQYNPSMPNPKNILMSKWHLIENHPLLREIYREPPLISYKRGKSLKDILVRAKL